jgi:hypothetical protein
MTIMKASELIAKYQKVWDNYTDSYVNKATKVVDSYLLDRGFEFQFDEDITNPDILFIGVNPSFKDENPVVKSTYLKPPNKPGYFRPFYKLEEDLKKAHQRDVTWTHVDLLAVREPQQSYIENYLYQKKKGAEFTTESLAISKEIIEHFNPKVIVVPNLLGRELMSRNKKTLADGRVVGNWMDCEYEFDTNLGTDVISSPGTLNGVPVFFTGMLSGQKSLDRGTFQRLVWHIDSVLNASK